MAALAGFAGFLGVAGIAGELVTAMESRTSEGRAESSDRLRARAEALLQRLGRLIASAPSIRGLSVRGDLESRLLSAGEPAGLGLREWIAVKVACAVTGGLAAAFVGAGAPARLAVVSVLVTPVVGFFLPDLWLARLARRRLEAALRELPDMLDLLRVTVEAGMPPARAMAAVGEEFRGPLAGEWRRASTEIRLGVSQEEAFASLGSRLPAGEVGSLVEALARARRHGAPLGRALRFQATAAREAGRRRTTEQAAKAGPKVQLAVALLLVPAVMLIVVAAMLAELEGSGMLVGV